MPEKKTPASRDKSRGLTEMAGGRLANEVPGPGVGGAPRELRPKESFAAPGLAGAVCQWVYRLVGFVCRRLAGPGS